MTIGLFLFVFQPVSPLRVVTADTALRLKAILDFFDEKDNKERRTGDEWLFEGPATYIPRKEVNVEELIQAKVVNVNQAIRLCAKRDLIDQNGQRRVTGEEWLIKTTGAYLPQVDVIIRIESKMKPLKRRCYCCCCPFRKPLFLFKMHMF